MKTKIPKAKLLEAKDHAADALLRLNDSKNVIGVGIGNKFEGGIDTGVQCVRVYVLLKFAKDKLAPSVLVPDDYLGVQTDVIEVGRYGQTGQLENVPDLGDDIGPGCAIRIATTQPNVNSGAFGTLGTVVTDANNQDYILSCNHILAVNGRVQRNSDTNPNKIFPYDKKLPIATYEGQYVPLKLDAELTRGETNQVDCALGKLLLQANMPSSATVSSTPAVACRVSSDIPKVFNLGKEWVQSPYPIKPTLGHKVVTAGAMSGTTVGKIVDIDAEGYIDYSFGRFRFGKQVVIDSGDDAKDFAIAGDSGALVWDTATKRPVAMIFAGAGRFAVACPLQKVFHQLRRKTGLVLKIKGGK